MQEDILSRMSGLQMDVAWCSLGTILRCGALIDSGNHDGDGSLTYGILFQCGCEQSFNPIAIDNGAESVVPWKIAMDTLGINEVYLQGIQRARRRRCSIATWVRDPLSGPQELSDLGRGQRRLAERSYRATASERFFKRMLTLDSGSR